MGRLIAGALSAVVGLRDRLVIAHELDRVPWRRALSLAGLVALFFWFAYWGWRGISDTFSDWPNHLDVLGIDGRLYYRAAQMWLSGGDPWTAYTTTNTWPASGQYIHFLFTGPPPTVLAFVPFAWIPETPFVIGWFGLTVAAAVYTLRRLHLPVWWLMFPPLAQGIIVANPQIVCLALLLCGSSWLRALAAPMKAYAVIPMVTERQWRALTILVIAGIVSLLLFWPLWRQYIADYAKVQDWIIGATYGGFSAAQDLRLFALTASALALLALIDTKAAGWLAVPALWPAAQYYYATFALPLRSPWLAAALVFGGRPGEATVPWAINAYVACRLMLWLFRRARTSWPAFGAHGVESAPGE